uniref:GyrI-like small molecule binding domain-containing protein n=1 Tax=Chlorobium chlorochromatii (strain CaD3) TaxID=340177 RepID=Q3ASQ3_CHLCH
MEKRDLKKELRHLYNPSPKAVEMVDVPTMNFLMVDGMGDPNTSQTYADAIEALFSLSYTIKFMVKKGEMALDYGVMPLESLWWCEDMSTFSPDDKSNWQWRAMIMQPSWITEDLVNQAIEEVKRKKGLAALPFVRFEAFEEGVAAQIMHIGHFAEEAPTIEKLHHFIAANQKQRRGKHHEIYLSDIRKAKPEAWKTIIRQPLA